MSGKQPRAQDVGSISGEKPAWQLSSIDADGKWGWKHIGKERWETKILPALVSLETMTWAEIECASGGRKQGNNNHFVPTSSFSKEARERLEEIEMDDLEEMFSLRIQGRYRIYGKRVHRVLQIIWFDFQHEVYPTSSP